MAATEPTLLLDVNETLFSLEPIRARFDEVGIGRDQVPLWFARVLRDGFAAAAADNFTSFPDLARHHLHVLGPDVDADHVISGFDEVEPHPDVAGGLRAAHDAGCSVATVTNGTAAITRGFLERAGLDHLVDHVLDVSGPRRWKPDPTAYGWALDRLATSADDAVMIAVHPWDVHGAMRAGLRGAWVDRDGATWPTHWPSPDVRAPGFDATVAALLHPPRA